MIEKYFDENSIKHIRREIKKHSVTKVIKNVESGDVYIYGDIERIPEFDKTSLVFTFYGDENAR